jgi:hypothetical protein
MTSEKDLNDIGYVADREAVTALLNAKRLEIHGDKAVLGWSITPCEDERPAPSFAGCQAAIGRTTRPADAPSYRHITAP